MPTVILLIAVYLLLVFVLPLTLSAAVSYRSLPVGRACPHCAAETVRVEAKLLGFASACVPSVMQRRFCLSCGWDGLVRLSRHAHVTPLRSAPPPATGAPDGERTPASSRAATRTVDVRWLTVDGVPWRVQLECWRQTGLCYGRLVFVEPSGRLWLDAQPFAGRTDRDVLGQALSLPDRLLASRLRELVSD
jgi:hypothetical protein